MPKFEGINYRNATNTNEGGWAVTDKIFGYLDKAGDIYNKIRYPQPGDPDYIEAEAKLREMNKGVLGLQKPWGAVVLLTGFALLGWGIYKIAIK